jgi:hypothetical protein
MFYIVHILAGAVIARFFPGIIPIIILGIVFHFLIDMIPHRDTLFRKDKFLKTYKVDITASKVLFEFADIIPSLFLIAFLWLHFQSPLMMFSIFISILPDISRIGYVLGLKDNKIFIKYLAFHSKIQTDLPWIPGLLTQLIASIILIILLFI